MLSNNSHDWCLCWALWTRNVEPELGTHEIWNYKCLCLWRHKQAQLGHPIVVHFLAVWHVRISMSPHFNEFFIHWHRFEILFSAEYGGIHASVRLHSQRFLTIISISMHIPNIRTCRQHYEVSTNWVWSSIAYGLHVCITHADAHRNWIPSLGEVLDNKSLTSLHASWPLLFYWTRSAKKHEITVRYERVWVLRACKYDGLNTI